MPSVQHGSVRTYYLQLAPEFDFLAPLVIDEFLRVGNANDGGYVVPKCSIAAVDSLVSFGISNDWSFEENFKALNSSIQIHAYDHTISDRRFRREFQRGLVKFALGAMNKREIIRRYRVWRSYKLFFGRMATHFQERIHNRADGINDATLDQVFGRIDSKKVFLKIDIEGSEYRIIWDIVKYSARITAMVIEFHETDSLREVFCKSVRALQERFDIVHVHGNNYGRLGSNNLPDVLEITFVNKHVFDGHEKRRAMFLPEFDRPNDPACPDFDMQLPN